MHRYESATNAIDNIIPTGLHRRTNRTDITYEEFVTRYARRQAFFMFGVVSGVFVIVGAIMNIQSDMLVWVVALGAGVAAGGTAGFLFNWHAHNQYLDGGFGVTTTEMYQPAPKPTPPTVRPFVPSTNGTGKTTNTGRLDFAPTVWRDLFDRALDNGGQITRDSVAKPAGVGREWYHGDGYGRLLEELTRLGFIDGRNRLTPAALAWYEQQIALPLAAVPVRSPRERTNGGRTDAERGIEQ